LEESFEGDFAGFFGHGFEGVGGVLAHFHHLDGGFRAVGGADPAPNAQAGVEDEGILAGGMCNGIHGADIHALLAEDALICVVLGGEVTGADEFQRELGLVCGMERPAVAVAAVADGVHLVTGSPHGVVNETSLLRLPNKFDGLRFRERAPEARLDNECSGCPRHKAAEFSRGHLTGFPTHLADEPARAGKRSERVVLIDHGLDELHRDDPGFNRHGFIDGNQALLGVIGEQWRSNGSSAEFVSDFLVEGGQGRDIFD